MYNKTNFGLIKIIESVLFHKNICLILAITKFEYLLTFNTKNYGI